jgi:hypothetical protein
MLIKLFLISCLIFTYLHIIIHFTITKQNSIYRLYDVTKDNIHSEIMNKVPFYFNGSTIQSSLKITDYKKIKQGYEKMYESIELLEPSVRFFATHFIIPFKKYIKLHRNLECRNFYKISKGSALFICIHPKYKSLFKHNDHIFEQNKDIVKYIESNSSFIHILLNKDNVLFLPNYWLLFIVSKEDCIVEKIQYSTILNQPCFKLKKYI